MRPSSRVVPSSRSGLPSSAPYSLVHTHDCRSCGTLWLIHFLMFTPAKQLGSDSCPRVMKSIVWLETDTFVLVGAGQVSCNVVRQWLQAQHSQQWGCCLPERSISIRHSGKQFYQQQWLQGGRGPANPDGQAGAGQGQYLSQVRAYHRDTATAKSWQHNILRAVPRSYCSILSGDTLQPWLAAWQWGLALLPNASDKRWH